MRSFATQPARDFSAAQKIGIIRIRPPEIPGITMIGAFHRLGEA
jgi:hypothetical protein